MKRIISFNSREVNEVIDYVYERGKNLWIDVTDPSLTELASLKRQFGVSVDRLIVINSKCKQKEQKQMIPSFLLPYIHILDNYSSTLLLDLKHDTNQIDIKEIYTFLGKGWIITVHSSKVEMTTFIHSFINQIISDNTHNKDKPIVVTPEEIYQQILYKNTTNYKRILRSLELEVQQSERNYIQEKTITEILDYYYNTIRLTIFLRRCIWYTRKILNFLMYAKQGKKNDVYLTLYNDFNDLINLVEFLKNIINQKRHFYGKVYRFKG